MPSVPPIPVALWDQIPPAAQEAILALVQGHEQRLQALQQQVAQLTERLNQNSTNSSRPPSSDPPHVKRRPRSPQRVANGAGSLVTLASNARWCRRSRSSRPSH